MVAREGQWYDAPPLPQSEMQEQEQLQRRIKELEAKEDMMSRAQLPKARDQERSRRFKPTALGAAAR